MLIILECCVLSDLRCDGDRCALVLKSKKILKFCPKSKGDWCVHEEHVVACFSKK